MTEKMLLFGNALVEAGAVESKRGRGTASDWMDMEKRRGISVSSTVLRFEHEDKVINLLDTPGHSDFSEDTLRVMSAVDGAIILIDAAKGIESQTLRLFEVARSRGIPLITFINKCDRPGIDPLELLDHIDASFAAEDGKGSPRANGIVVKHSLHAFSPAYFSAGPASPLFSG